VEDLCGEFGMLPATDDRCEDLVALMARAEEFLRRGSDKFFLYPPGGNVATDCDSEGLEREVDDIWRSLDALAEHIREVPFEW
jgi:hypothetical protein